MEFGEDIVLSPSDELGDNDPEQEKKPAEGSDSTNSLQDDVGLVVTDCQDNPNDSTKLDKHDDDDVVLGFGDDSGQLVPKDEVSKHDEGDDDAQLLPKDELSEENGKSKDDSNGVLEKTPEKVDGNLEDKKSDGILDPNVNNDQTDKSDQASSRKHSESPDTQFGHQQPENTDNKSNQPATTPSEPTVTDSEISTPKQPSATPEPSAIASEPLAPEPHPADSNEPKSKLPVHEPDFVPEPLVPASEPPVSAPEPPTPASEPHVPPSESFVSTPTLEPSVPELHPEKANKSKSGSPLQEPVFVPEPPLPASEPPSFAPQRAAPVPNQIVPVSEPAASAPNQIVSVLKPVASAPNQIVSTPKPVAPAPNQIVPVPEPAASAPASTSSASVSHPFTIEPVVRAVVRPIKPRSGWDQSTQIIASGMPNEMQQFAVAIANQARAQCADRTMAIAQQIALGFEQRYGQGWCCMVSNGQLGFCVRYDPQNHIYYVMHGLTIFLYKCQISC